MSIRRIFILVVLICLEVHLWWIWSIALVWELWAGVEFLFLQRWGYCGNGIHCTGGRTTWSCRWNLCFDWSLLDGLRGCRIGILLACSWSWLEEVTVPSENGSTWSFYHVGVGFLAFLSNNCFFPLPRNRILEPYILSWF